MTAGDAHWPGSLVLLGAGKMGGALLRGWLAQGLEPARIHVVDPHMSGVMAAVCESYGINNAALDAPPEALVLAIKPQTFSSNPGAFAGLAGPGTLVVSILAGQTLVNLRGGLPLAGSIVRAMPNLPASVGRGITSLTGEPSLGAAHQAIAQTLLGAVGQVEWLDEALIDAVTAVSGSGPAYVFLLTECLAAAGEAAGLPPPVAARLARATVEGAGELMATQPGLDPAALREAVTSRGGTTAAALDVLCAPGGLAPLMEKAVAAAKARAKDLAG